MKVTRGVRCRGWGAAVPASSTRKTCSPLVPPRCHRFYSSGAAAATSSPTSAPAKVVVTRALPEATLEALRTGGCAWEGRYWSEAETAVPRSTLLSWLSPDTLGTHTSTPPPSRRAPPLHAISHARARPPTGLYCLLTDRVDGEVLDRAPNLRVVSSMVPGLLSHAHHRERGFNMQAYADTSSLR
jgi:hypothetical protein